jgi:isopenicillin-N epimerase
LTTGIVSSKIDSLALRHHWLFPPDVTFLNHGSFGPSPRPVLQARQQWLERVQSNPMDFFVREYGKHLETARERLASYIGSETASLAFVTNATTAMNSVAASVQLQPGDEVLTNDHEYGAVIRLWEHVCQRAGAKLVVQQLPVPFTSSEQLVERIVGGITPRTRLLVFSHITSATAVIFPAEELCRQARQRGVAVCIDGPHAVSMLPLSLSALDCDYYLASCHKWLSAPIGSGFIYVHPRAQATFHPAVLSWGRLPDEAESRWNYELEWSGTHDPAPILSIPAAIDFLDKIGLQSFREYTRALAQYARQKIGELTGLEPLTPDSPDWYGSMISLFLPDGEVMPLQQQLWERYRIESLIIAWQGRRLLRVSCHVYTSEEDIDRLVNALREVL